MSEKTVYDYAIEFFKTKVVQKKEALEELEKQDRAVQFRVSDGKPFVMEVREGQIRFEKGEIRTPDIEVEADSQTFVSIFSGEMKASTAFLEGKLFALKGWVDKTKPYFPWLTKIIRIGQGR